MLAEEIIDDPEEEGIIDDPEWEGIVDEEFLGQRQSRHNQAWPLSLWLHTQKIH